MASTRLLITPVCFRWLIAFLAVLSFAVPAAMPSAAAAAEAVPLAMSAPAAGDGVEVAPVPGQTEDLAESGVETFAGDYSHDPYETDKLLLSFAVHWDASAAVWGGFYTGVQPPDPVFSFERPPRPFFA